LGVGALRRWALALGVEALGTEAFGVEAIGVEAFGVEACGVGYPGCQGTPEAPRPQRLNAPTPQRPNARLRPGFAISAKNV
jgi:hypothetical protein